MKQEYLKTVALLKTIPAIAWIDRDKGQLEFYEIPPVEFPCALIKTTLVSAQDIGGGIQKCLAEITVRVATNFVDETSAVTPDDVQQTSLEYYDHADAVYLALQGKAGGRGGSYSRIAQSEEKRDDGITVVTTSFSLPFIDKSAAIPRLSFLDNIAAGQ